MTSCQQVREQLSPLVDDRLPASSRVELEGHLAGCSACQAELDALRADQALLEGLTAPALDPALIERTVAAAEALPSRRSLRWALPLAAAAALFLIVALLANQRPRGERAASPTASSGPSPSTRVEGEGPEPDPQLAAFALTVHTLRTEVTLLATAETQESGLVFALAGDGAEGEAARLSGEIALLRQGALASSARDYLDHASEFLAPLPDDPVRAWSVAQREPGLLARIDAARLEAAPQLPPARDDELDALALSETQRAYVSARLRGLRGDGQGAVEELSACVEGSHGPLQDAALRALSEEELELGEETQASLHALALVGNPVYAQHAAGLLRAALGEAVLADGRELGSLDSVLLLEALDRDRLPIQLRTAESRLMLVNTGDDALAAELKSEGEWIRRARGGAEPEQYRELIERAAARMSAR